VVPAFLVAAALLGAPGPRATRSPGTAAVVYVTRTAVYLDAGGEDGLAPGLDVELRRGGEPAGRCRIDSVAPHAAVCAGAGARVGDQARFEPPPAVAEPAPKLLPPPPDPRELERRLAALSAAPAAPLVAFEPSAGGAAVAVARARTADAALTHASWKASGSGGEHREALDVVIRGAEVADGLTLDVDARAERGLRREAPRFRPRDDTQLYLWQAQLTATPGDALVLSAGRVLPWGIPGASLFDGALVGVRRHAGDVQAEVGGFGGLVPDPVTTGPAADRATGGGYWVLDGALGRGASFRQEGRVAVVRSPELGTRTEASLTGRLFLPVVDLSDEAHLGAGGRASAGLDAGRVDVTLRPVAGFVAGASYRQTGLAWPQLVEPAVFPGRSRGADAFAYLDLGRGVRVGATGGLARDLSSGLDRTWIGPELGLPRLLGARGGLTVGYLEETGWLRGRSAYAQLAVRPWDRLRAVARASWTHDSGAGVDRDELGLFASAAAELTRNLGLRLSVLSRAAVAVTEEGGGSTPYGVTGLATLVLSL
jgi:hypothetical protein